MTKAGKLGVQAPDTKVQVSGSSGGLDRRPLRFWAPFNEWWREELGKLGRRPSGSEIHAWYTRHAAELWKEDMPSLQETRVHAKCLRSLPLVREYFRNYRSKRRAGGLCPHGDGDAAEAGEGLHDTDGGAPAPASPQSQQPHPRQVSMQQRCASAEPASPVSSARRLPPAPPRRQPSSPQAQQAHSVLQHHEPCPSTPHQLQQQPPLPGQERRQQQQQQQQQLQQQEQRPQQLQQLELQEPRWEPLPPQPPQRQQRQQRQRTISHEARQDAALETAAPERARPMVPTPVSPQVLAAAVPPYRVMHHGGAGQVELLVPTGLPVLHAHAMWGAPAVLGATQQDLLQSLALQQAAAMHQQLALAALAQQLAVGRAHTGMLLGGGSDVAHQHQAYGPTMSHTQQHAMDAAAAGTATPAATRPASGPSPGRSAAYAAPSATTRSLGTASPSHHYAKAAAAASGGNRREATGHTRGVITPRARSASEVRGSRETAAGRCRKELLMMGTEEGAVGKAGGASASGGSRVACDGRGHHGVQAEHLGSRDSGPGVPLRHESSAAAVAAPADVPCIEEAMEVEREPQEGEDDAEMEEGVAAAPDAPDPIAERSVGLSAPEQQHVHVSGDRHLHAGTGRPRRLDVEDEAATLPVNVQDREVEVQRETGQQQGWMHGQAWEQARAVEQGGLPECSPERDDVSLRDQQLLQQHAVHEYIKHKLQQQRLEAEQYLGREPERGMGACQQPLSIAEGQAGMAALKTCRTLSGPWEAAVVGVPAVAAVSGSDHENSDYHNEGLIASGMEAYVGAATGALAEGTGALAEGTVMEGGRRGDRVGAAPACGGWREMGEGQLRSLSHAQLVQGLLVLQEALRAKDAVLHRCREGLVALSSRSSPQPQHRRRHQQETQTVLLLQQVDRELRPRGAVH